MPPDNSTQIPEEEQSEDFQPSPLGYARQNGIARDYLSDTTAYFRPILHVLQRSIKTTDEDDPDLPIFSFGHGPKLEERMTLTQDAAKLLGAIARLESIESSNLTSVQFLDSRCRKRLKLELPLLTSDHERDCREFVRRDNFEIRLQDVKLPLESVDEEKGEGLTWPRSMKAYGPALVERLRKEKLMVKRDTMAFIQISVSNEWTAKDEKKLWDSEQKYTRTRLPEPMTPIFLSPPTSPTPYEASSQLGAFDMPVFEPTDLTKMDLAVIEQRIFEEDVPAVVRNAVQIEPSDEHVGDRTVSMKDVYSPLASSEQPHLPDGDTRRKSEDYKVETPLIPKLPESSPTKAVRFPDIRLQIDDDPGSASKSDGLENQFFEDAFLAHEKFTRQSEQEQLVHADALSRVVIPKMDFTLPDPPWKDLSDVRDSKASRKIQNHSIQRVLYEGGIELRKWQGVKKAEDKLTWKFPTELGRLAMQEHFPVADKALHSFVSDLQNEHVVDSSAVVWKATKMGILEDEDDDDEIEKAKFVTAAPADMSSLVKKRKMLIEEETAANEHANATSGSKAELTRVSSKKARVESSRKLMDESAMGTLLDEKFSARAAVDNYMEMKGTKKVELSKSSFSSSKVDVPSHKQTAPSSTQLHQHLPVRTSPLPKDIEMPVPIFNIPTTPFYIIMSTAMYKKKDLVRSLERILPTLTIIERDFTTHDTTSWLPGSVSRSPIISPLASEADFIVSPSMGIIITTLQKIGQKPLPGQKEAKSEIRARVEQVSLRYENLLVLISEDNKSETTNGLDSYGSRALSEFMGYKAGLDCIINVQFVPGGDQILSKWLMSAIVQHRNSEELLSDQTHWELFLRRAGMNAFAAQVVLAQMKAPEGVNGSSPSKAGTFGLIGFVEMARRERIARFENLCGRKLLKRVSEAIEGGWR